MEPQEEDSISTVRRNTVVPEGHVDGSGNTVQTAVLVSGLRSLEVEDIHGDRRDPDHLQENGMKLNGDTAKQEIVEAQSMAHIVNRVIFYNIKTDVSWQTLVFECTSLISNE